MNTDSFLTIEEKSEGQFKDKGSKFLAFAFPVRSEEEIRIIIEDIRKQYHDARHHCYAYRLGAEMKVFRANDDGEPSNSAGKPILGQIQSFEITDILIIVVRYFGGTLLGVGGLIHAYKTAAFEALSNARIIKKYVYKSYLVRFRYEDMNLVMKVLKDMDLEQYDQKFGLECELKVKVKNSDTKKFPESFRTNNSVILHLLKDE